MALANQESINHLSFMAEGELPPGANVEEELDQAMAEYGGTLRYWNSDASVGEGKGFERDYFQRKFEATLAILESKGIPVDPVDIHRSQDFIEEVFGVYEGTRDPYRQSGSFAFVAATRVERKPDYGSEFSACDYRKETVGCIPLLKYVDSPSAQRVMVGLPPFVLDYYGEDHQNGGGTMIFSPLFLNLLKDSKKNGQNGFEIGLQVAQETSWFAKERLGVKLMSLAALLPKHTGYGAAYSYPGIEVTTGHGGTTWLIADVVRRLLEEKRVDDQYVDRLGVLGVGGIGFAAADTLLAQHPDSQVAIFDRHKGVLQQKADTLRERYGNNRVIASPDTASLLRFGGITVSAITKGVDLQKIGLEKGDLVGRAYADDSQPAAIASEQVEAYGGLHVGVVAEDPTDFGAVTGTRFNYGGMGPLKLSQAYGCCVEGAVLHYSNNEDLRVTEEITGDKVRKIGALCAEMGFSAAPLQTLRNGRAEEV